MEPMVVCALGIVVYCGYRAVKDVISEQRPIFIWRFTAASGYFKISRFGIPAFLRRYGGRAQKNLYGKEKVMNMKVLLMKAVIGCVISVMGMAGIAAAATNVGVDVNTPNVRVQVGTPAPPPPVMVVEHERTIVRERDGHHDNGKHKGHHKKHKKNKHHDKH